MPSFQSSLTEFLEGLNKSSMILIDMRKDKETNFDSFCSLNLFSKNSIVAFVIQEAFGITGKHLRFQIETNTNIRPDRNCRDLWAESSIEKNSLIFDGVSGSLTGSLMYQYRSHPCINR